jgi:hypothetical protein
VYISHISTTLTFNEPERQALIEILGRYLGHEPASEPEELAQRLAQRLRDALTDQVIDGQAGDER